MQLFSYNAHITHFSSNRLTMRTNSDQPPWMYLTYTGTLDSQFAPTKSYCLLLVMSLAPVPGRASGGVGKTWRSAELYDKELAAH